MKILCKLSFILFVLFQLVTTSGGAKLVSSGVPHSEVFDKNDTIKMTGYLASSIWQEVSSVVQNGWQKTVAFAKTLTNKTANNSSEKVIVQDEKSATGHNTNSSSAAVVDNNHSTARNPFTRKFIQQENLSYYNSGTAKDHSL
jgi:CRISPR/Cas system CMR-associated protein Cmr5 small subunit